jgi:beta-galactosidase/beta-glucuronidase
MATRMTQVNLARLSRRTGGLDRLAGQYKQQVANLTDTYAREYGAYQKQVGETMAPYEAAMERFRSVDQPQYQASLEEYNKKLAEYQRQVDEVNANPTKVVNKLRTQMTRFGPRLVMEQVEVPADLPDPFTETPPAAPTLPEAPKVQAFDASRFESAKAQMQTEFSRETGERKAARLNATRRNTRTMLGGVKA